MKTRLLLAISLLLPVTLVSCGNPATTTTPAPPNSPELVIVKALKVAGDTIQSLTPMVATHPEIKGTVNNLRATYTEVKAAYLVYHDAATTGQPPDPTALAAQINQLISDSEKLIAQYKGK